MISPDFREIGVKGLNLFVRDILGRKRGHGGSRISDPCQEWLDRIQQWRPDYRFLRNENVSSIRMAPAAVAEEYDLAGSIALLRFRRPAPEYNIAPEISQRDRNAKSQRIGKEHYAPLFRFPRGPNPPHEQHEKNYAQHNLCLDCEQPDPSVKVLPVHYPGQDSGKEEDQRENHAMAGRNPRTRSSEKQRHNTQNQSACHQTDRHVDLCRMDGMSIPENINQKTVKPLSER
jgi:hypothetical protein